MSPASAGCPLEVERYIGACLITQNRKFTRINNNNNEYYHNREYLPHRQRVNVNPNPFRRCHQEGGWADGVPLISFTNHHGRIEQERQDPLARLAVHTVQGAPLIVTKSFNHRKNKQQRSTRVYENSSIKKQNHQWQKKSTDTVSVTSDESSASSNVSENCLPRIIKPRKRRKKDRKPPLLRPPSQESFSTDSASPDIVDSIRNFPSGPFVPFSESLHILSDISETPKLHHRFEDVEEPDKDINDNQCQCRYCDPSGQIWDVDRDCYSPFLTPPLNRTFHFPNFYSSPLIGELERGMSSVSLEDERNKNWIGKNPPSRSSSSSSCRDLEVSTEIVTSLNGHRDLEIKFFSTPSVN